MTYFKPLLNWLVTENVRQGEILGWPDFSCSFEGLIICPWSQLWSSPKPYPSLLGQPLTQLSLSP